MCPSRQTPPRQPAARRRLGFTLLEVIVIITVGGLLAALVVNLTGTQLMRASNPAAIASDAAEAETAMEAVVANYTGKVNSDLATALDTLKTDYTGNSTVSITDTVWNSERVLTVTTTVGDTSYTTLLTQARTSAGDNATNF